MVKALLIGDCHLADKPPSLRTETYTQDILDKLAYCVKIANDQTDVMVLLGDVFHIKLSSRNSHALVQATASVLEQFKGRVLIVPGNHDLSQNRLESLPSQPLGTLALSPNIELLDGYDEETKIVGIPYLDSFEDFHARLEGLEAEPIDPAPVLIATHASIFPDNQSPPYAHMNASGIDTGGIPLAYGHIHDPHFFYQSKDGTWFCNNGAISRGSLHEETVKREPAVTIFDSEAQGCPFTSVPIPFRPASEVFRLAEHVEKVEAQAKLDGFLESITSVQLTNLSLEQVIEHAKNAGLPETAQQELEDIVQFAQS